MASEIRVDTVYNESGDSDSGLDMSTNDVVAVKIAGSEKVRVHSDGRLAVGTASPSHALHVDSGSTDGVALFESSGDANAYVVMKDSGSSDGAFIGAVGTSTVLGTGGSTVRMTIDSSGHVTMPYQTAFYAHKNGTDQDNFSTGSYQTVTWSHEQYDVNGDFASNTFTAPVTGKYLLCLNIRLHNVDTAANYYIGGFLTSNQRYNSLFDPDGLSTDATYWTIAISALAEMDANDTATVVVYQSGGSAQTDIGGSNEYTWFSGCLLC